MTKHIQESLDRYDLNEQAQVKEDQSSQQDKSQEMDLKGHGGNSSRFVEQKQYLPIQKLKLLNIEVGGSSTHKKDSRVHGQSQGSSPNQASPMHQGGSPPSQSVSNRFLS